MLKNPTRINFPHLRAQTPLKTNENTQFKEVITQLLLGQPPFGATEISRHFDRLVHPLLHRTCSDEQALIHFLIRTYGIDLSTAQLLLQEHHAMSKARIAKKLAHDVMRITTPELSSSLQFTQAHLALIRHRLLTCTRIILNPNLVTLGLAGHSLNPLQEGLDELRFLKIQSEVANKFQLHHADSYDDLCRVLEIFSMNFAYEDLTSFIEQKKPIETPIGSFMVTKQLDLKGHKDSKIKAYVFEPVSSSHLKHTAFLVFRGTVPVEYHDLSDTRGNIVSDIGPLGAGGYEMLVQLFGEETAKSYEKMASGNPFQNQFLQSQISQKILSNQINSPLLDTLKDLKKRGYQVITSGHSLGGAMAVLSYCVFPGLVRSVIVRSAPGMNPIFSHVVRNLLTKKVGLSHRHVRYYNNFGDVISGYQQPFGEVFHVSGNDPAVKHLSRYNQDQLSSKTQLVRSFMRIGPLHSTLLMLAPVTFLYHQGEFSSPMERTNLLASHRMVPASKIVFKVLK